MYRKLIGDNLNHQVPPLYIVLTQIRTIDTQRVHNEYTTAVERFPSTIVSSAKDVAAVPAPLNARKRRSAKRSARRHRQRRWRSDVLALIFLLRLRRRVRLRRDLVDLEELRDVPTELASKRGRAVREESSSSSSGTGSLSSRSSAFFFLASLFHLFSTGASSMFT